MREGHDYNASKTLFILSATTLYNTPCPANLLAVPYLEYDSCGTCRAGSGVAAVAVVFPVD